MNRRAASLLAMIALIVFLLPGSALGAQRRTYSFSGPFDTFTSLIAYTDDGDAFDRAAKLCESEFRRLHELFNAYRGSDTVHNIYELNRHAGEAPMSVEPDLMDLLLRCRELQSKYPDTVNVALGRMLGIWHEARSHAEEDPFTAYVPDIKQLREAAAHASMDDLVLDPEAGTVFYADPLLRLDLGAVAKGYAAGIVAEKIAGILTDFSLNAGGNIVCRGTPDNDIQLWKAGIQNPDESLITSENPYLCSLGFTDLSLVTSGDYLRFYAVDGVRYHHIIDPVTLMPAGHYRAVIILTPDALSADFYSTAAFILPYEKSRALIESAGDTEAMWVFPDGTVQKTPGFAALELP